MRARVLQWLCQVFTGHAQLLVIERGRMYVSCEICGRTSPGWDVEFRAPRSNVVAFRSRKSA